MTTQLSVFNFNSARPAMAGLSIVLLMCSLFVGAVNAEPVTKAVPIEALTSVHLSGAGRLVIVQGDALGLEVTADQDTMQDIEIVQKGEALFLGRKRGRSGWSWFNFNGDDAGDVLFVLSLRELSALNLTGASEVKMESLVTERFSIEMAGASKVRLGEVNATEFYAQSAGASRIYITQLTAESARLDSVGASQVNVDSGTLGHLNVSAVGASKVDTKGLQAEHVKVDAVGASNVVVHAAKAVDASAAGASSIRYAGSPASVKTSDAGASSVKPY